MKGIVLVVVLGLCWSGKSFAQSVAPADALVPAAPAVPLSFYRPSPGDISVLTLNAAVEAVRLPSVSPELALQTYERQNALQAAEPVSYSAYIVVHADLSDTFQEAEYDLQQTFTAPKTLKFKAVRSTGDIFVKSNVILRLLQAEVNHAKYDDPALTAVNAVNYKFLYKGRNSLDGRLVHVFQVKPRKKRSGLFKGYIYLDASTCALVRAEGKPVRSPSFFVKKIQFIRDYANILSTTLPVRVHFEAHARIVGRTVVDVLYRDYRAISKAASEAPPDGIGRSENEN